jgi:AcrR family transcriptional regulator
MPRNTDPIAVSVWTRPPRRSRRDQPPLSRDQIVSAAIELLDAEGLDGLSMRRLGERLDAGATSAYWYVANKDELLELAVDKVMGELDLPDPADVGWRTAARVGAQEYRAALLRHPWVIGLMGARPTIGPNAMRMGDRMIGALAAAGLTGTELAFAGELLSSHAVGSATLAAAMHRVSDRAGKNPNELVAELDPYLQSLQAEYPNYIALWYETRGIDMDKLQDDGFNYGLERLLDGLEMSLRQPRGAGRAPGSQGVTAPARGEPGPNGASRA